MNMIGHDHKAVDLKAMVLFIKTKVVGNDIFIRLSGKNIYPVYNSKRQKMRGELVVDLITCAHSPKIRLVLLFYGIANQGICFLVDVVGGSTPNWHMH